MLPSLGHNMPGIQSLNLQIRQDTFSITHTDMWPESYCTVNEKSTNTEQENKCASLYLTFLHPAVLPWAFSPSPSLCLSIWWAERCAGNSSDALACLDSCRTSLIIMSHASLRLKSGKMQSQFWA